MNFDDVNDFGFVVVKPGKYTVKLTAWKTYVKEETGNRIFQLEYEIVGGEYAGEQLRDYQVINNDAKGRSRLFRLYKNLGIVEDSDRLNAETLDVEAVVGEPDEDDKCPITSIKVNGESRDPIGRKATATVVEDTYDGQPQARIKYIDAVSVTPGVDNDVPF